MASESRLLMYAALLPAIVLLIYVYSKDKVEKEPMRLVLRLFGLGALAGPIAAVLEGVLIGIFEAVVPVQIVFHILKFFVGVAVVEEGLKYLFLSTIRKNPEFNYVFDGVVYAVAVSLGFAALENLLYVFQFGWSTAIMRALLSVPGHCAYGVLMGCFFGMARHREITGNATEAKVYYWLAFILPVIEHGFYDAGISSGNAIAVTASLIVQVALIIAAMILVHRLSLIDQAIYPNSAQQAVPQRAQAPQPVQAQQWQAPQQAMPQQGMPQQGMPQQAQGQQWQTPQPAMPQQSQAPQPAQAQQWQAPQQAAPQQVQGQQWQAPQPAMPQGQTPQPMQAPQQQWQTQGQTQQWPSQQQPQQNPAQQQWQYPQNH